MEREEQIENNWNVFCDLVESMFSQKQEVTLLLDTLGERLATCPATTKSEYGSLVETNLKVFQACRTLNKKFKLELTDESMAMACLFRNLGLVGDLNNDLFVEEDKWHQDRGMMFKYNNDLQFMKPFDRTVYLLNHFGVKLTQDEYLSLITSSSNNENYNYAENPLAFAVYAAVRLVGFQNEKEEK